MESSPMMNSSLRRFPLALAMILGALVLISCEASESPSATPATAPSGGSASAGPKKSVNVAFVTNNASDFWQIAKAGVNKAEKEFGVTCDFVMPDGTAADQQRLVEAEMAKNVNGMAISP